MVRRINSRSHYSDRIICSLENPTESKEALRKHFVSGFAAILLLSQAGQVLCFSQHCYKHARLRPKTFSIL